MKKSNLAYPAVLILVAAVVFSAVWPVVAADYVVEYEMTLNDVAVSTERSMIVNDDQRIIISSETEMITPQPLKMRSMLILNNFTMRPEAYYLEADVRGATQKLDATFTATQCQYRAEHAAGVQNGAINLPENYLVWENNVWIQLMYLVSGFKWEQTAAAPGAAGASGSATAAAAAAANPLAPGAFKAQVLIPTTMSLLSVIIEDRGSEKITIEGAALQARRIALNFGGTLIMDVWLESDTRIPLKISIPAQKLLVVRKSLTLIDPADPAAEEDYEEEEAAGEAEEAVEAEQEETEEIGDVG